MTKQSSHLLSYQVPKPEFLQMEPESFSKLISVDVRENVVVL